MSTRIILNGRHFFGRFGVDELDLETNPEIEQHQIIDVEYEDITEQKDTGTTRVLIPSNMLELKSEEDEKTEEV